MGNRPKRRRRVSAHKRKNGSGTPMYTPNSGRFYTNPMLSKPGDAPLKSQSLFAGILAKMSMMKKMKAKGVAK